MPYPTRLGQQTIEEDAAILATLLDVSAFTITDPLYTYTLLPYATDTYEIGSATEYYREGWFLALQIGDDTADYQGSIWGSGSISDPQLEISAAQPFPSAASNRSLLVMVAPGPSGSSLEDSLIYILGGDDNAVDLPRIELWVGADKYYFIEGAGLTFGEAGTIEDTGTASNPQLTITADQPYTGDDNVSELYILAPGYGGGSAVTCDMTLLSGDGVDNDPYWELGVGLAGMSYTVDLGLNVTDHILANGGGLSANAGWPETGTLYIGERSSNPSGVAEGEMILWMDDGGGDGDDGDIMITVRAQSTTKVITLVDFSAF